MTTYRITSPVGLSGRLAMPGEIIAAKELPPDRKRLVALGVIEPVKPVRTGKESK